MSEAKVWTHEEVSEMLDAFIDAGMKADEVIFIMDEMEAEGHVFPKAD